MIKLDNIKLVLWDFDDTLYVHNDYSAIKTLPYFESVLNKGSDAYNGSCNEQLKWFMKKCESLGIKQGLISHTRSYITSVAKNEWVKKNYGVELENYCVSSDDYKLAMMYALQDSLKLYKYNILLIDDLRPTLEKATEEGFKCCTPLDIVNLWNLEFE